MNFKSRYHKDLISFVLISIACIQIFFPRKIHSEYKGDINDTYNSEYTLGPGDKLFLQIYQLEKYSTDLTILPDGKINLPRLGLLNVKGLKLTEAENLIAKKYETIIRDPLIYLNLIDARPTKITITGEVVDPGFYVLPSQGNKSTIIAALRKAGGIASQADIREITVKRYNKDSNEMVSKTYNFWAMLNGEIASNDPIVYDGDIIHVKKIKDLKNIDFLSFTKNNLAPKSISVNVLGEVMQPGQTQISSRSSLNNAIYAAGGVTRYADKRSITLIRLLNNGKISKSKFKLNLQAPFGSTNNPSLREKDLIIVSANIVTKAERALSDVTKPFTPVLNSLSIYNLLSN